MKSHTNSLSSSSIESNFGHQKPIPRYEQNQSLHCKLYFLNRGFPPQRFDNCHLNYSVYFKRFPKNKEKNITGLSLLLSGDELRPINVAVLILVVLLQNAINNWNDFVHFES